MDRHVSKHLFGRKCVTLSELAVLGKVNNATQLADGHRTAVRKHKKEVDNNRHILSKIFNCKVMRVYVLLLH